MKTAFDFELHVISCAQCGAPVAVGSAGGRHECGHCRSAQIARASSRAIPRAAPLPEAERVARLRRQDTTPLQVPVELSELFMGLELLSWKSGQALAAWRAASAAAEAQPTAEVEQRLHRLTMALSAHFERAGDPLRARSLLESALDACREPRHCQALSGALARSACRAGDPVAAEAWLALCDPTPHDLTSDTAFRLARATIDTQAGRFDRVLQVLGAHPGEVPIDNEHEAECVALRANALERSGHAAAAADSLDHFYSHIPPVQRYLCERIVARGGLCLHSAPVAAARQQARALRLAGKAAGAPKLALIFGVSFSLATVAAFVPLALFVSVGLAHFVGGIVGLLAVTFLALSLFEVRKWLSARRVRRDGAVALARIVHARGTGQWTMGVPQLLYRVEVLPESQPPFMAHAMFHADAERRARFLPGALAVARFDPNQRGDVQLDLDGA